MKHSYQNEGVASGDVEHVGKELKTFGNKNFINYTILLKQETSYKDETKTKHVLVNFFRTEESHEIELLNVGDNITVFFRVQSNLSEKSGRYFSNINGDRFIMLVPAEKQEDTQQQQITEEINNSFSDNDIPF